MASQDPEKPNVILVFADDLATWAIGAYGSPDARTPTLDQMAVDGTLMENFFCTSPVCSPARASLLTGKIPSQHGVHDWVRSGNSGPQRIDFLAEHPALHDYLSQAGYRCGLLGKWHLGASDAPRPAFDDWYAYEKGGGVYYEAPMYRGSKLEHPKDYLTDVLADEAVKFITDCAEDPRPFYLNLSFTAPHYPWLDAHPQDLLDLYADCTFESIPREPSHPWLLMQNPETYAAIRDPEASLRGYFAAVSGLDRALSRIFGTLERQGLGPSTLVAFVGDNGFNAGHHGIWGKGNGTLPQNMYDTSVRVPAIFVQPGRVEPSGRAGQMASGYDLLPTLIDYLDLPAPAAASDGDLPGHSFAESLRGGKKAPSQDAPIVVFDEYGPVRMIRTSAWKLVDRYPDGPHELFHLQTDPEEKKNRFDDPSCTDVRESLTSQLESWFERYADPVLDGRKLPVLGLGQKARVLDALPEDAFVPLGPPDTVPVLE